MKFNLASTFSAKVPEPIVLQVEDFGAYVSV